MEQDRLDAIEAAQMSLARLDEAAAALVLARNAFDDATEDMEANVEVARGYGVGLSEIMSHGLVEVD